MLCLHCNKEIIPRYSTHQRLFCNHKCQQQHKSDSALNENKKLIIDGKITNRPTIYKVLVSLFDNKCSSCGLIEWLGEPIKNQVDHIDGNSENNKLNNLRLLCPNCHSQTDTFAGRNKGKNVGRWTLKNLEKYR
jgi:hypothetical protein